jgi:hypothetical protein
MSVATSTRRRAVQVPAPEMDYRLAAASPLFHARELVLEPARIVKDALAGDKVATRILGKKQSPATGELVGVRLNINIAKATGICVHSIHRGTSAGGHRHGRGFWRGEVITYRQVVRLRHAFFNVHQAGREAIASGAMAKHPMASVDGEFIASRGPHDFSGIEVRFNPKAEHLFVDMDGYAIRYADEVTLYGNRAYARGRIVYFDARTAPKRAGRSRTAARLRIAVAAPSREAPVAA